MIDKTTLSAEPHHALFKYQQGRSVCKVQPDPSKLYIYSFTYDFAGDKNLIRTCFELRYFLIIIFYPDIDYNWNKLVFFLNIFSILPGWKRSLAKMTSAEFVCSDSLLALD